MSHRNLGRIAIVPFALALTIACAGPEGGPMTGKDLASSVLGGYSVGGIDLGAAVGVATKANEAYREIPQDEEVALGRSISAGLLGAAPLSTNAAQQNYVNRVGMWLALQSGRPSLPWHFGIIESPTVNAFATPGGNIFVTRGLVERCSSEAELAGVLAHEIAHVVQFHQLNDIRKNAKKGMMLDLASLKSGGLSGDAARAFARVGLEGYVRGLSREDELEADRIGVVIAARAGYEPYGLVMVLQTLQAMPPSDSSMAFFLKTHPSPSDRIAALEAVMPPSFEQYAKPNPSLTRFTPVFAPARK